MNFFFVLSLLLGLGSIMLTSLFSLFYVTGEYHRFLHRGRADYFAASILYLSCMFKFSEDYIQKLLKTPENIATTTSSFHCSFLRISPYVP